MRFSSLNTPASSLPRLSDDCYLDSGPNVGMEGVCEPFRNGQPRPRGDQSSFIGRCEISSSTNPSAQRKSRTKSRQTAIHSSLSGWQSRGFYLPRARRMTSMLRLNARASFPNESSSKAQCSSTVSIIRCRVPRRFLRATASVSHEDSAEDRRAAVCRDIGFR